MKVLFFYFKLFVMILIDKNNKYNYNIENYFNTKGNFIKYKTFRKVTLSSRLN